MSHRLLGGQKRSNWITSHIKYMYVSIEQAYREQIAVFLRKRDRGDTCLGLVVSLGELGILQWPAANETGLLVVKLKFAVANRQNVLVLFVPCDAADVSVLGDCGRVGPEFFQAQTIVMIMFRYGYYELNKQFKKKNRS